MEKASLSVIIITYNEERNIRECLESVRWADEIVVVDSFSMDRTVEIAEQYTSKVFQKAWTDFSQQKNFALEQATGSWVLNIDADERVTPSLKEEIQAILPTDQGSISGYYVPRRNYYQGRWIKHCGWYPDYQLRLFRRGTGSFGERAVHESIKVKGKTEYLKHPLDHYAYNDFSDHLKHIDMFTTLSANQMLKEGKRPKQHDLFLRPLAKFMKMFLLQRGFLDGIHGLMVSVMGAVYVFLKYAKLWELGKEKKDR